MQAIAPIAPNDGRFWKIVQHPAMLLLIGVVLSMAVTAACIWVGKLLGAPSSPWFAVLEACGAALAFIAMYFVLVRGIERRAVADFSRPKAFGEIGAGLVAGTLIFSCVVAVIAAFGDYHVVGTRGAAVMVPVLAIAIQSGFTEEIVFRGIIFRLTERWFGSWIALALSALLFGLLHIGNPHSSLFAAVCIAFEAGILLAAVYMLTRRLWAAIGLHAAWNFAEGGIYSTPVSGMDANGVLVPKISGPDAVTGGFFGPEASWPGLGVATAFGLLFLYFAWRQGKFVPFLNRAPQLEAVQE